MISFDDTLKENTNEHNSNWLQNSDPLYTLLIARASRYGKTNHHLI